MATLAGAQSEAADAAVAGVAAPASNVGFAQVVAGITAIVAPATLVTSIAFYFGWVHTDAWARHFGLDPSVLGLTTRDYVLASLRPLFLPVISVLVVLIAFTLAHAFVSKKLENDLLKGLPHLWKALMAVGAALFVAGASAVLGTVSTHYLFGTLAPAAGVILITYAISLRRRLQGQRPLPASAHVLVALLAVLSFFWAAGIYAGTVGRAAAQDLGSHLRQLPGAVIYSAKDLDIPAGYGVREVHLVATSEFPYAYSGLRLLKRSDGKYFLLSRWWTPRNGAMAVVLPESDSWRIALFPGVRVRSHLSAAEGGGLISAALPPVVAAAHAERVRLPSLDVEFLQANGVATIDVSNRLRHRSGRVVASGALSGGGRPLVTADNARCTVSGRRFDCLVRALGPHGTATITIEEKNGRAASGKQLVRLGRTVVRRPLDLDPRG